MRPPRAGESDSHLHRGVRLGMLRRMTNTIIRTRRTGESERNHLRELSLIPVADVCGVYYVRLAQLARDVLFDLEQAEAEAESAAVALRSVQRPVVFDGHEALRKASIDRAFYAHRARAWKRLLRFHRTLDMIRAGNWARKDYELTRAAHGQVIVNDRLRAALANIASEFYHDPICPITKGLFCAGCHARRALEQNGVKVPA